jgi:hypothetical protein
VGGAAALLAVSHRVLPFKAAVTFGALTDTRAFVDYLSSLYGAVYEWADARRELSEQTSVVHRSRDLAESGASLLFGIGSEDVYPFRESIEQLASGIRAEGGEAEVKTLVGLGHGFVDEPGDVAVSQGPQAQAVDRMAREWFSRLLT